MIVDIVNVFDIPANKAEDHAPIRAYHHREEAFQIAFERMQAKAGHFKIRDCASRVETCKDVAQLLNVFSDHAADIIVFVKPS